jgi:hypothetical protein
MRILAVARVAGVILVLTLVGASQLRAQDRCDEKQDQWFHQKNPSTWRALYGLFEQFGGCDDGAIAEGFSDDVAELLLKQWAHLDTLNRLMTSDTRFKKFVLRHIDSTLDEDQLKEIKKNATAHCPARGTRLCASIRIETQRALQQVSR